MSEETPNEGIDLEDLPDPAQNATADVASDEVEASDASLEAVYDIPVTVKAVLGSTEMQIHELLKLGRGAVVKLDRKIGDAVDIYVNDRLVARGEIVIQEDQLGITMTEIVKSPQIVTKPTS